MAEKVKMIGIDYNQADVEVREAFAWTKSAAADELKWLMKRPQLSGCVLLSTCNRMELWCVCEDVEPKTLIQWICERKKRPEAASYFVCREQEEAVRHLFWLAGGLKSLIPGDDQILTQLKDALTIAREAQCAGSVLEVMFRHAITAGKKVRTQILFDKGNCSAAVQAVDFLKEKGCRLVGKQCLVIGNGEMGRQAALALVEEGAQVTVTVRQYRSGIVCIPKGCRRINYGERYDCLADCQYVISATASPNVTIRRDDLEKCERHEKTVFVDLAVPRDIDPQIAALSGVILYDIDDLKIDHQSERMKTQFVKAESLLEQAVEDYQRYERGCEFLPLIQKISTQSAQEICWRMGYFFQNKEPGQETEQVIGEAMQDSSRKVINKLLFALRKELTTEEFARCLKVLDPLFEQS